MKPKNHCTVRDIAVHSGVSPATVSRALRHDSRITEAVRLKVVKAAAKLGYRRDPKLAQLMSHVRATRQRAFQGTLAWITDSDLNVPAEAKVHDLYWPSAVQHAEALGYKLECFPNARHTDAARIERRLRAQGIQGIVIQQFKAAFHLPDWPLHWRQLATVHNGSCQTRPSLDSVDADGIANCVAMLAKLTGLGYQRIGICTTEAIERAVNFDLGTALRRFSLMHPGTVELPSCLLPDLSPASARTAARWLKRHRVDCVVSQVRGMKELLESTGRRVPEDIGLAWQGVNPNHRNSGMLQREDIVATTLLETLIASVEQGRLGFPGVPRLTLIPGTWYQGTTCKEE
ncbi:MAG: LacI family DNA-binding transcriptional regulator [Prosthecobacter sp.]|nr:LacI family DNA-binding transcriptional regulator [Prosthecobacter sp.]